MQNIKKVLSFFVMFGMLAFATSIFAATPDGTGPWADSVLGFNQGLLKNGGAVTLDRSDSTQALGIAESNGSDYDNPVTPGTFFALGFGGWIELGFINTITNGAGNDFQIYEITGGTNYPDELVDIEVSNNGVNWHLVAEDVQRDALIDLDGTPFECIHYVKVTDVSNANIFEATADGYDVDGAKALHSNDLACLGASIDVEKTASAEEVIVNENVTYTYTVTNDGDIDIDEVSIDDNKCNTITGPTGDNLNDGIMNPGEVWTYYCTMPLAETTTNIVTITANDPFDEEVSDSDEITVAVQYPGCTLTQGFWKTHSSYGPAPVSDGWNEVGGPDAQFLDLTEISWYELFWMPPVGGNAYIQLAHQYMAAKLNVENEADPTVISATLLAAETILDGKPSIPTAKSISKTDKNTMLNLAGILGSYNEGLIGPGHCSEQDPN